jgi:glycosyltransferase involved in cell wall biosynthesis
MPNTPVSVLVHTCNSESTIGRLLDSVSWAHEVIVIDMGSSDATVNIVTRAGATLHHTPTAPWRDELRNSYLTLPKTPWTLVMDSDEHLANDAESLFLRLIDEAPEDLSAMALPRVNYVLGKRLLGATWYPDFQIRLFRTASVRYTRRHHQPPKTVDGGQIMNVPVEIAPHIYHTQSSTLSEFISKQIRYASTDASDSPLVLSQFQERALNLMLEARGQESEHERALLILLAWTEIVAGLIAWEKGSFENSLPPDFGWCFGFVPKGRLK